MNPLKMDVGGGEATVTISHDLIHGHAVLRVTFQNHFLDRSLSLIFGVGSVAKLIGMLINASLLAPGWSFDVARVLGRIPMGARPTPPKPAGAPSAAPREPVTRRPGVPRGRVAP